VSETGGNSIFAPAAGLLYAQATELAQAAKIESSYSWGNFAHITV